MHLCLHEFEVKGILDGTITELWRPVTQKIAEKHIEKLDDERFAPAYIDTLGRLVLREATTWLKSPFGPVGTRIARSPICLPQGLSRLTLINAGVECKPIREITDAEAIRAGYSPASFYHLDCDSFSNSPREQFRKSWDARNAKKGYPFESAYGWKLKFEAEVKR